MPTIDIEETCYTLSFFYEYWCWNNIWKKMGKSLTISPLFGQESVYVFHSLRLHSSSPFHCRQERHEFPTQKLGCGGGWRRENKDSGKKVEKRGAKEEGPVWQVLRARNVADHSPSPPLLNSSSPSYQTAPPSFTFLASPHPPRTATIGLRAEATCCWIPCGSRRSDNEFIMTTWPPHGVPC